MKTYTIFAQAYGTGAYACGEFGEGCSPLDGGDTGNENPGTGTETGTGNGSTTQPTDGILAPLTGFIQQPGYIVYPTLLAVAVIIGSITFALSKALKRR